MSPKPPPDADVHPDLMAMLRPTDAFGVPMPKRLGLFPLLGVAVQAGVPMKKVPDRYWRVASDARERELQAVVDCVCGETNVVPVGRQLVSCPGCDRWFFYAGAEVLAFSGPT